MSRTANPIAVGGFIVGTLTLAILLVLFFSSGNWFSQRDRYVLIYDTSVKGLNIGAPVTMKGVKIGEVIDIKVHFNTQTLAVFNTVVMEIDPSVLKREGGGIEGGGGILLDDLIKRGLRAQLKLQSLLTGLLYVDVDFHPKDAPRFQDVATEYPQVPTIPTDLEQLTRDLESIDLAKLGKNIQQIVEGIDDLVNDQSTQKMLVNANATLVSVRQAADSMRVQADKFGDTIVPLAQHSDETVQHLNRALPQFISKLDATMASLQQSADALQKTTANMPYLTSEDSALLYRIESAASSINGAAEQLRRLSDTLEKQPESLLFGKQEN